MHAEMKPIRLYADVLPGYSLKARAEYELGGTHQIVLAKHLQEGLTYHYQDAHLLRIQPKTSADKYRIKAGDVLFIARGIRNQSILVDFVPELTIASSTLYILRIKNNKEIIPAYLAWCLNQTLVQSRILQVRTGAGTPLVQRKLLGDIPIPIPPWDKQVQIAELAALMQKEKQLRQQLLQASDQYHEKVGKLLLKQFY
ncbi:MAG: restriction endonuclease subunit S [Proteobacteria bacterium]|nr:restriction endonuclease subunit S [Pseudomonadota bacterium]